MVNNDRLMICWNHLDKIQLFMGVQILDIFGYFRHPPLVLLKRAASRGNIEFDNFRELLLTISALSKAKIG